MNATANPTVSVTSIRHTAATRKSEAHSLEPGHWPERYGEYLVNYARGKVSDHALAEDLVQDTFLAAWKGRKGFRGDCTERTWLTGVLRNKIIDHYRSAARRPTVREADVAISDQRAEGGEGWIASLPTESPGGDPVVITEQREFMTFLDQALAKLPDLAGRAFHMREIQGCSTEEITRVLNISRGNLWVLIHRAKSALRNQMELGWAA
jgi:RNA polymerase sigma-70 factor (ECF subfamily)